MASLIVELKETKAALKRAEEHYDLVLVLLKISVALNQYYYNKINKDS